MRPASLPSSTDVTEVTLASVFLENVARAQTGGQCMKRVAIIGTGTALS
jgi:hypothetical protein